MQNIIFLNKLTKLSTESTTTELGTLEWINFNPDFSIRISTVETFHFSPNPLFFSLLGYPLIVFSNENISVLSLVVCFSLIGYYSFSDDYRFSNTFKIISQDYVNLEIIKKRGSSINPDIHNSNVFSSGCRWLKTTTKPFSNQIIFMDYFYSQLLVLVLEFKM